MEYSVATSYDRYENDLTHWAIVYREGAVGYDAYPFSGAGELVHALKDWRGHFRPDNGGFAELLDAQERGANVFPSDDVSGSQDLPEPFPWLLRFEMTDGGRV